MNSDPTLVSVPEKKLEGLIRTVEEFEDFMGAQSDNSAFGPWRVKLEQAVWGLQSYPLIPLKRQFESMVAELSRKLGKTVQAEFEGFDFSVSAKTREALSLALLHGIRNALDHGIESEAERQIAKKSTPATIKISLTLASGSFHLNLTDDGRGPEFPRIGKRAVDMKLASKYEDFQKWPTTKKLEILFEPGFSTRVQPTEWSGRGIGLDAVRNIFQKLGGTVRLQLPIAQPTTAGESQGLCLLAQMPADLLFIEVYGFEFDGIPFWIPYEWVQLASVSDEAVSQPTAKPLTEHFRTQFQIKSHLAPDQPTHNKEQIQFRVNEETYSIEVTRILGIENRLFRPLDPSFEAISGEFLKEFFHRSSGRVLACKAPNSHTESRLSPAGLGFFLDSDLIQSLPK